MPPTCAKPEADDGTLNSGGVKGMDGGDLPLLRTDGGPAADLGIEAAEVAFFAMAVSATFRTIGGGGILGAIYTVDGLGVSTRRTPFGLAEIYYM